MPLSSFKSNRSKRFKALMKVRPKVKRIVGLTGTPSSNGLMDLWAEFRLLDMGERLGKFIGQYREIYFKPDKRNGPIIYSYKLLPFAEDAIYEKISDITVSMKAEDYLKMPEKIKNEVFVNLSDKERDIYETLRKDLVVSIKEKDIDAVNSEALSNKLLQMASGSVYDEDKNMIRIHDRKIDALEDLIEGANGKPVPIAYWYKSDLKRIKDKFDVRELKTSKDFKE
ncbi:SNF2-related protein [Anaerococcus vaginalis]|uniref:SNF2-related protein n=1 Tax=Anaerococcus vaginalis TaxID=33037 RepID=UPI00290BE35A|nr:SNF2-related protein [Anaerococcus vaginalis]MDU5374065.1 SNF2-related protein [Anaerococcus vaginalis]